VTAATLAAGLLASIPLLAACDAGQAANTKKERFAEGTYVSIGKLRLQNVQLHPLPGQDRINGTAVLTFSVFNDGQNRVELSRIDSDSGGQVQPGIPSSSASGSVSTTPSPSTESASASPSTSASASASASTSASPSRRGKRSPSPSASTSSSSASASVSSSASPSSTTPSPSQAPPRALPVPIPAGGALVVGPTGTTQLVLTGLDQSLLVGRTLILTFQFDPGGSSGRIPVPVTPFSGTTASSTPTSQPPTSYPAEPLDPSYYQTPFDDLNESAPPEPAGK
jgi:hypothetical protein